MRGVALPAVKPSGNQARDDEQGAQHESHSDPFGRRGDAILRRGERLGTLVAMREVVLSEKILLIETQIARDGTHKPAVENAAGEFVPILVFQSLQKTQTDARGDDDLVGRDFTQFALTLQTFPKISPGHELNLSGEASATQARSARSCEAWRLTATRTRGRCGLPSRAL